MAAKKSKNIPTKKLKQRAGGRIVPKQDINTVILRDAKENLTDD